LNSHLSRFNPEELQAIIELIEMRSLGRARGWEVTARYSALGDEELMDKIANRCRTILKIIGEEVPEKSLATALENRLRDEIVGLQTSVDDYEEEMDEILANVNDVLINVYEEKFSTLEEAVNALIVEYHEAMEEAEDEDEEDEVDVNSLSELDKIILLEERAEREAAKDEDEDEEVF